MTEDQNVTIGEIGRSVTRIENSLRDLTAEVKGIAGPVSELKVRVETAEKDINELGTKVAGLATKLALVEVRAAGVAGGVSALIFVVKLWLGK